MILFVKYVENSAISSEEDSLVGKEISLDLFNNKLTRLNKHLYFDLDLVIFSLKSFVSFCLLNCLQDYDER